VRVFANSKSWSFSAQQVEISGSERVSEIRWEANFSGEIWSTADQMSNKLCCCCHPGFCRASVEMSFALSLSLRVDRLREAFLSQIGFSFVRAHEQLDIQNGHWYFAIYNEVMKILSIPFVSSYQKTTQGRGNRECFASRNTWWVQRLILSGLRRRTLNQKE